VQIYLEFPPGEADNQCVEPSESEAEMATRQTVLILGSLLAAIVAAHRLDAAQPGEDRSPRVRQNFDSDWRFHLGDVPDAQSPEFADRSWRLLDLPHDWSIEGPFDEKWASGTGFLPGGIGWYRKNFDSPQRAAGQLVQIQFDGVYKNAEVWINGHSLGRRPNGFISYSYDLTPHLRSDNRPNVLAVRVDHSDFADSRFYTGSGIYRHVWLEIHNPQHIARWGTFVTTPSVTKDAAAVAIETRVLNATPNASNVTLATQVVDGQGNIVGRAESGRTVEPRGESRWEASIEVKSPALWSPETPQLYTVVTQLRSGPRLLDEERTRFGIRTFHFDPNEGFTLNGVKTVFKGVCIHQDEGAFGAAVPLDALKRRLQIVKDLGANAIRTSHNPPAPELLDLCDEMGFLVMDEAFDEWARAKKKWVAGRNRGEPSFDGYARDFDEWAVRDLKDMVERDKNHPSVVLWSIGNEIDFDRDPYFDPHADDYTPEKPSAAELTVIAKRLHQAVKEVDTTRPVTAGLATLRVSNRTGLADVLDVVGYNYQEQLYADDHVRYPQRKIIGSENSQNYAAWRAVLDQPFANGQFLWTAFDYHGEAPGWPVRGFSSGLADEAGFKKPQYYFRQSLWSDRPMVYLAVSPPRGAGGRAGRGGRRGGGRRGVAHWTWPNADGQALAVACYSNCEQVELVHNGNSLGKKLRSDAENGVLNWQVPYAAGTLKAVGMNGNAEVCSFELKSAGSAAAVRLKPDRTTLSADGRSFCFVEAEIVDADGNPVFAANHELTFEVDGPAKIVGVDSGDLASHESFRANSRRAYQGRCLVIIQSSRESGRITVKATTDGLSAGVASITAGNY
jgi:beta-galactosidase